MEIEATQAIPLSDFDEENETDDEQEDDAAPVAHLKVLLRRGYPETVFPIYEGINLIGRDPGCNIHIDLKALSKQHAVIEVKSGQHFLVDKGSKNKSRRNKMFLLEEVRYEIRNGDKITFADVDCIYNLKEKQNASADSTKEIVPESGSETGGSCPMISPVKKIQHITPACAAAVSEQLVLEESLHENSEPSSDLLQPTQNYSVAGEGTSNQQSSMSKLAAATLCYATDSDDSDNETAIKTPFGSGKPLVEETPMTTRTKRTSVGETFIPDSQAIDTTGVSEAPTETMILQESDAEEERTHHLAMEPTQAYGVISDSEDDEPASPILDGATQAYPALRKSSPKDKKEECDGNKTGTVAYEMDVESTQSAEEICAKNLLKANIPIGEAETQAYDMDVQLQLDNKCTGEEKKSSELNDSDLSTNSGGDLEVPTQTFEETKTGSDSVTSKSPSVKIDLGVGETMAFEFDEDSSEDELLIPLVKKPIKFKEDNSKDLKGNEQLTQAFEVDETVPVGAEEAATQAAPCELNSKDHKQISAATDDTLAMGDTVQVSQPDAITSKNTKVNNDSDAETQSLNILAAEKVDSNELPTQCVDDMETQVVDILETSKLNVNISNNMETQVLANVEPGETKSSSTPESTYEIETQVLQEDATQVLDHQPTNSNTKLSKQKVLEDEAQTQVFVENSVIENNGGNKYRKGRGFGAKCRDKSNSAVVPEDQTQILDSEQTENEEGTQEFEVLAVQAFDKQSEQNKTVDAADDTQAFEPVSVKNKHVKSLRDQTQEICVLKSPVVPGRTSNFGANDATQMFEEGATQVFAEYVQSPTITVLKTNSKARVSNDNDTVFSPERMQDFSPGGCSTQIDTGEMEAFEDQPTQIFPSAADMSTQKLDSSTEAETDDDGFVKPLLPLPKFQRLPDPEPNTGKTSPLPEGFNTDDICTQAYEVDEDDGDDEKTDEKETHVQNSVPVDCIIPVLPEMTDNTETQAYELPPQEANEDAQSPVFSTVNKQKKKMPPQPEESDMMATQAYNLGEARDSEEERSELVKDAKTDESKLNTDDMETQAYVMDEDNTEEEQFSRLEMELSTIEPNSSTNAKYEQKTKQKDTRVEIVESSQPDEDENLSFAVPLPNTIPKRANKKTAAKRKNTSELQDNDASEIKKLKTEKLDQKGRPSSRNRSEVEEKASVKCKTATSTDKKENPGINEDIDKGLPRGKIKRGRPAAAKNDEVDSCKNKPVKDTDDVSVPTKRRRGRPSATSSSNQKTKSDKAIDALKDESKDEEEAGEKLDLPTQRKSRQSTANVDRTPNPPKENKILIIEDNVKESKVFKRSKGRRKPSTDEPINAENEVSNVNSCKKEMEHLKTEKSSVVDVAKDEQKPQLSLISKEVKTQQVDDVPKRGRGRPSTGNSSKDISPANESNDVPQLQEGLKSEVDDAPKRVRGRPSSVSISKDVLPPKESNDVLQPQDNLRKKSDKVVDVSNKGRGRQSGDSNSKEIPTATESIIVLQAQNEVTSKVKGYNVPKRGRGRPSAVSCLNDIPPAKESIDVLPRPQDDLQSKGDKIETLGDVPKRGRGRPSAVSNSKDSPAAKTGQYIKVKEKVGTSQEDQVSPIKESDQLKQVSPRRARGRPPKQETENLSQISDIAENEEKIISADKYGKAFKEQKGDSSPEKSNPLTNRRRKVGSFVGEQHDTVEETMPADKEKGRSKRNQLQNYQSHVQEAHSDTKVGEGKEKKKPKRSKSPRLEEENALQSKTVRTTKRSIASNENTKTTDKSKGQSGSTDAKLPESQKEGKGRGRKKEPKEKPCELPEESTKSGSGRGRGKGKQSMSQSLSSQRRSGSNSSSRSRRTRSSSVSSIISEQSTELHCAGDDVQGVKKKQIGSAKIDKTTVMDKSTNRRSGKAKESEERDSITLQSESLGKNGPSSPEKKTRKSQVRQSRLSNITSTEPDVEVTSELHLTETTKVQRGRKKQTPGNSKVQLSESNLMLNSNNSKKEQETLVSPKKTTRGGVKVSKSNEVVTSKRKVKTKTVGDTQSQDLTQDSCGVESDVKIKEEQELKTKSRKRGKQIVAEDLNSPNTSEPGLKRMKIEAESSPSHTQNSTDPPPATKGKGRGKVQADCSPAEKGKGRGKVQPDSSPAVKGKGRGKVQAENEFSPAPKTPRGKGRGVKNFDTVELSTPKARGRGKPSAIAVVPSPGTPSRRLTTMDSRPKVMFTGVVDEEGQKIVKNLGGLLVDDISECTHLVTDKVRRTVKFLCGMARGLFIVKPEWLEKCKVSGVFIDASLFLIKDNEAEKTHSFSLKDSLTYVQDHGGLLVGYRLHVTKGVKPDPSQMKEIIASAGGEYLTTLPKKVSDADKTVVISCSGDLPSCKNVIKLGIAIVSAEFILTGLLQQKLHIKKYSLISAAEPTVTQDTTAAPTNQRIKR